MDFIAGEILYFNKPLTWTSFDLVNKFRYKLSRKLKVKKPQTSKKTNHTPPTPPNQHKALPPHTKFN